MIQGLIRISSFLLLLLISSAAAKKDSGDQFQYDPVQNSNWAVVEDSAKGIHGAAMLFEKVTVDDEAWVKSSATFVTTYRRIRILSAGGKSQGDVTIPYYEEDQKLMSLAGRTILRDGTIIPLEKTQVFEKEVVRTGDTKIKQQSFSMPGVTDDCIIEYMFKVKMGVMFNSWEVQKDIYLARGELHWMIFAGKGLSSLGNALLVREVAPQWVVLNLAQTVDIQRLPSLKEVNEVRFIATEVPAFEDEAHSLPETALRGQVRIFYSKPGAPALYWSQCNTSRDLDFTAYVQNSKRLDERAHAFDSLSSDTAKILAVYQWVQQNLKNVTYMKKAELDKIKPRYGSAEEALKAGMATRQYVNYMFCDMLRTLNIDARVAWVEDRTKDILVEDAKYWQFNRTLVAVPDSSGLYHFYSPGDRFLPPGMVPWFNEGVEAFLVSSPNEIFHAIPFSASNASRISRSVILTLQDDFTLAGHVSERRTGHEAREIRTTLADVDSSEWREKIQDELKSGLADAEFDSVWFEAADSTQAPLRLGAKVSFPEAGQVIGGQRLLLRPCAYFEKVDNPFTSDARVNAVIFDYAHELDEALTVEVPSNWTVEALPKDTFFQNSVGKCGISFTQLGSSLAVQRSFKLTAAYSPVEQYGDVKQLFETYVALSNLTVPLLQVAQ